MREIGYNSISGVVLTSPMNSATQISLKVGLFSLNYVSLVPFSVNFALHMRKIGRKSTSDINFDIINEPHVPISLKVGLFLLNDVISLSCSDLHVFGLFGALKPP
jgi:hypothetical protein